MVKTIWVFIAAGIASLALLAQTKPDFSGTWKLDTLRSRFDPKAKPPKSETLVIEQHGPNLRIQMASEGGSEPWNCTFDLPLDGTEVQSTAAGETYTASARWGDIDGTHLILTIKHPSAAGTIVTTRQMKVGDQDRIMTTVLTTSDAKGEKKAYEFYSKEPS